LDLQNIVLLRFKHNADDNKPVRSKYSTTQDE